MNIFAKATRCKLRVETVSGLLSVAQLWDLKPTKLSSYLKVVNKKLQETSGDDLSFLDETNEVDPILQLTFEVLKEIYLIKRGEEKEAQALADMKKNNEEILAALHEVEKRDLLSKTPEELRSMLKK